jgi:ElaA protein
VPTLRIARFADLDPATLYALLRLRVDVFVVEQKCPYAELDGRDTEPGTRHLWLDEAGAPIAYLRLLTDPSDGGDAGVVRIGRVCTARPARGGGHAARLMRAALDEAGGRECVLEAQSYLVPFYTGFGFTTTGPEYLDDGIPHVPMRRPAP